MLVKSPLIIVIVFCVACGALRKSDYNRRELNNNVSVVNLKKDSLTADTSFLPFEKLIKKNAISQRGLFTIHKVEGKYYFQIPDSLLKRDILIVNRIIRSAAENRPMEGYMGYGGDQIGESIVQFTRNVNKVYITKSSYSIRSTDSTENGLSRAVNNSNVQPIIAAFDLKAITPDSSGIVIDITDLIKSDSYLLFFSPDMKSSFGIGALQEDKSYIDTIVSFPKNTEIRVVKTYAAAGSARFFTFELNSSIILLPRSVMPSRHEDPRIGYFGRAYIDFDLNPQGISQPAFINRWRLEPRSEDEEKYLRGELVEPKKPIVYYIDPATPKKWIPYLIKGVNDWQKAFELAGFKNAIYAIEAPTNNPGWSLEDAAHNVLVYKPSRVSNASGPIITDPRSGEILESHVNWYHNIMQLMHDWYMIQAGAVDDRARKPIYNDSLMGELIRYVCSHEIGHTLGLTHNFGASSTIPVEKLRDKDWLSKNGHTPSIMDYARFNYVAQPEDSIDVNTLIPKIGVYDEWAIEWGYRWLPQLKSFDEERKFMNSWIIQRTSLDPQLYFGFEVLLGPRNQSEDLGNNPMIAGTYGIKNLKRIIPHLEEWTQKPGEGYNNFRLMYGELVNQYKRYLRHVVNYVGSQIITPKTVEEKGVVYSYAKAEDQREAIRFLQDQLFTTPEWLIDKKYFALINQGTPWHLLSIQEPVLQSILSLDVLFNLMICETISNTPSYTSKQLLNDMYEGIWKELKSKKTIDIYRRNLQKAHIYQLAKLLTPPSNEGSINGGLTMAEYSFSLKSDLPSLIKEHLRGIKANISKAADQCSDSMSLAHLKEMNIFISDIMTKNSRGLMSSSQLQSGVKNTILFNVFNNLHSIKNVKFHEIQSVGNCWNSSEEW
ncbi:MAG: zinc-dependent metalloprotease [Candidatus Pseudobacter hemicellulosilyticus]|uniref:Zinc-dependent metalloprotease n=1 Tax=Candidatus Pseudobacter hemicellulosilyticus TaxID=3121375 RepID=A0AAJ5WVS1_9BACT|nr:MAG: zinc-dependent metalloprotease [Pseudobacter sp.]